MAAAATPFLAAMALTSMSGTAYVIRTGWCRRSISRAVSSIPVTGTTDDRRRAGTIIKTEPSGRLGWQPTNMRRPERYRRRSSVTASATTATSEAMVYGFGSHPSGA